MSTHSEPHWLSPITVDNAIRHALCMLPMLLAIPLGYETYMVSLGQAGFFYANQSLPRDRDQRAVTGILLTTVGIGFLLIGGNAVSYYWLAGLYTLFVGIALGLLSNWGVLHKLAFSFISLYTAGLNSGSPERVHASFLAFALAMLWSLGISLLPFWRGEEEEPARDRPFLAHAETGVRLGIGASLAYFIGEALSFSRLGWTVAAVGNVVRFDEEQTLPRAKARMIGQIAGAILATVTLFFLSNLLYLLLAAYLGGAVTGLLGRTRFTNMPVFYTATMLILYSMNDPSGSRELSVQRIAYNLLGVLIGVFVVYYPFPLIMRAIRRNQDPPTSA